MSSHIVTDFEFSIKEGKLDGFKAIVNTMIEMSDMNGLNKLAYEWYINEDGRLWRADSTRRLKVCWRIKGR